MKICNLKISRERKTKIKWATSSVRAQERYEKMKNRDGDAQGELASVRVRGTERGP